ncbi:ogr/Delta-like zinc finger family protein [Sphingomonas sp. IC-56]|uniref:ogr/Delta-like zinc finger family protein n=1 Tax=Sphingomonas sp. IC-56 TaxID=2898529 RepID=UPI001E4B42FD|nr:ogr/Delta-like zinc finger family protein [Sphingomonas sp. IC-56]MCD2325322.1 ogr/Delta-like zinc finger family protein [Sphingomonas sp. IC-56]
MSKITRHRLPTVHCPHCRARSMVRTSEELTNTVREIRYTCSNEECNFSFVAQLSIVRTIRPSPKPNPDVHLPISNSERCGPKPRHANDDVPTPANDVEVTPPAAEITMSG